MQSFSAGVSAQPHPHVPATLIHPTRVLSVPLLAALPASQHFSLELSLALPCEPLSSFPPLPIPACFAKTKLFHGVFLYWGISYRPCDLHQSLALKQLRFLWAQSHGS